MGERAQLTLEAFFAGQDAARQLFEAVMRTVDTVSQADLRVTKSQVAFCHRTAFAWAWMPGRYLRGKCAPLVLSLALRRRDPSPRWKEVVEPAPGRFMHHLELYAASELDDEVRGWLQEAWDAAG